MGDSKQSLDRLARTIARDMAREMVEKKERRDREKRQRARESRALALELGRKLVSHCRRTGRDPLDMIADITQTGADGPIPDRAAANS